MPTSTSAVELTTQLVRMDTVNPPGQERACAMHVGSLLEASGFRVSYCEFAPGRSSLVARLLGAKSKLPLAFTGHLDTVPLGARTWAREPWGGEIDGVRLHGRGSSDMKSGIAAMVVAAMRLAPKAAASSGLLLIITAGEETGCEGAWDLVERSSTELGRAGALIVGEPTANRPYIGHKGILRIHLKARGVTAHASTPELGDNAVFKAARAALSLETFRFEAPPHPFMGSSSLNVGTFHGGLNINSVPDEATVGLDIRTVAGADTEEMVRSIRARIGEEAELTVFDRSDAVFTDASDPWVQRVHERVGAIVGEELQPRTIAYYTDAGALKPALGSPPTVILGPGEPELAHQTDEYCRTDRIEQAVAIYEDLIARYSDV